MNRIDFSLICVLEHLVSGLIFFDSVYTLGVCRDPRTCMFSVAGSLIVGWYYQFSGNLCVSEI